MATPPLPLDSGDYGGTYKLIGGALALEFSNTVSWRGTEREHDWLDRFSNYLLWGRYTGILNDVDFASLERRSEARPAEAESALQSAGELRESIYRLFSSSQAGHGLQPGDLRGLNVYLGEALHHLELGVTVSSVHWRWNDMHSNLRSVLWPVAWSAAELLQSSDLSLVRACESCGWLFLDRTRNHSRRWCTMEDCGNREKVRRYRTRRR
jgi:predicted RNA-binding Zn ribbon-like protein